MNCTPLRYPGGKSIMTQFFEEVIRKNNLQNVIYCEPYAGGAGAAINLLVNESVEAICINDACPGIYSFWYYLLRESQRFIDKVSEIDITLKEWQKQRTIFKTSTRASFELGFATFFLSRTNRSGILSAGPIGGQDEIIQQTANYKIDCRFNKSDLLERLNRIIALKDKINVSNYDALEFLKETRQLNALVYLDPPYYIQGKALYLNYYQHKDHVLLAKFLKESASFDWILSYDNAPKILELYANFPLYQFGLSYTAQEAKKGLELLTHSASISFNSINMIKKMRRNTFIDLLCIVDDNEMD